MDNPEVESTPSSDWPTEDDFNRLVQFFEPPDDAAPPETLQLDDVDDAPSSTPLHLMSTDELIAHQSAERRRWEAEKQAMQEEMKDLRRKCSLHVMRQHHVADLRWEMQKSRDSAAVARRAAELAIRSAKESARLSLIETAHCMDLVQALYGRTPEQSKAARQERRRCGWNGIGAHVMIDMPTLFANGLPVKTTKVDIYNRLQIGHGGLQTYDHVKEIWIKAFDKNGVTALVAFSSLKTARRLLRARPLFLHGCKLNFHYVPGTGENYRWAEELRRREREENLEKGLEEGEVLSESDDASSIDDRPVASPNAVELPNTAKRRGQKTSSQRMAYRRRNRQKRQACGDGLSSQ